MQEILWGGPVREVWERDTERWWEPPRRRTVQDVPPMSSAEFTRWGVLITEVEPYERRQAEKG